MIVEYQVFGAYDRAYFIALQYTATQYLRPTKEEGLLREGFGEFCKRLTMTTLGVELPRDFTLKLLDEKSYYPIRTHNELASKVGSGYINLSAFKNGTKMYLLNVKLFPSASAYQRFKSS